MVSFEILLMVMYETIKIILKLVISHGADGVGDLERKRGKNGNIVGVWKAGRGEFYRRVGGVIGTKAGCEKLEGLVLSTAGLIEVEWVSKTVWNWIFRVLVRWVRSKGRKNRAKNWWGLRWIRESAVGEGWSVKKGNKSVIQSGNYFKRLSEQKFRVFFSFISFLYVPSVFCCCCAMCETRFCCMSLFCCVRDAKENVILWFCGNIWNDYSLLNCANVMV